MNKTFHIELNEINPSVAIVYLVREDTQSKKQLLAHQVPVADKYALELSIFMDCGLVKTKGEYCLIIGQ